MQLVIFALLHGLANAGLSGYYGGVVSWHKFKSKNKHDLKPSSNTSMTLSASQFPEPQ